VGYTVSKEEGILADKDLIFSERELYEYSMLLCLVWGDQRGRLRSCSDLSRYSGLSPGDKLVYSEGH
jgi:hypothetical protein